MVTVTPARLTTKDDDPDTDNLGRHLSELIGAVGIYLGELGSAHGGDRERLHRAMMRAIRSQAFDKYMEADFDKPGLCPGCGRPLSPGMSPGRCPGCEKDDPF